MTLGEKIRILSGIRKISKEELAQGMNVSLNDICAWENGEMVPSLEQVLFLSRKFKVQMEVLVDQRMTIIPKEKEEQNAPVTKVFDYKAIKNNYKKPIWVLRVIFIILLLCSFMPYLVISFVHENGPYANVSNAKIEYMYIFLFFLPVPILSFWLGKKYAKKGVGCKKNMIFGVIISIELLLFASFSLLFGEAISHDKNKLDEYSVVLGMDIPQEGYFSYVDMSMGDRSEDDSIEMVMTFTNQTEISFFEAHLADMHLSETGVSYRYIDFHNSSVVAECDYFALYDYDAGNYVNTNLESGKYHFILVAYDIDTKTLYMIDYFMRVEYSGGNEV